MSLSTAYDSRFAIKPKMEVSKSYDYNAIDWVNVFDKQALSMLNTLDVFDYTLGSKPLTTVCKELYGTTSVTWLILMMNGAVHEQELPNVIKVPSSQALNQAIKEAEEDISGTVVIV